MHSPAIAGLDSANARMKEPVQNYDSKRKFPFYGLNFIQVSLVKLRNYKGKTPLSGFYTMCRDLGYSSPRGGFSL